MSTTSVAEPLGALAAFLQIEVGDMLEQTPNGPAIFRPDLPRGIDEQMPMAAIVIRRAGGYSLFGSSMMRVGDPRVDIVCYGGNQMESEEVALAVISALKQLVMQVHEGVMLYWANIAGGPLPLTDPQTLWPATFLSVHLMHGEISSA